MKTPEYLIGPISAPNVQIAAVMPPATEVKISAPLSSFASASAPKATIPNADLWEVSYPPTSVVQSERGNGDGPPGNHDPDDDGSKGGDELERRRKDKDSKTV